MFCSAVSVGSRLNAWNTNPTRSRRSSVSCRSPSRVISASPRTIRPPVTVSSPARQCISVDFPDPDGPMIAVNAPLANPTLTPRRACTAASPDPYTFDTPSAMTAGGGAAAGASPGWPANVLVTVAPSWSVTNPIDSRTTLGIRGPPAIAPTATLRIALMAGASRPLRPESYTAVSPHADPRGRVGDAKAPEPSRVPALRGGRGRPPPEDPASRLAGRGAVAVRRRP